MDDAARQIWQTELASDLTNSKTPQRKEPQQCEGRTARGPNSTKANGTGRRNSGARRRDSTPGSAKDTEKRRRKESEGERTAPDSERAQPKPRNTSTEEGTDNDQGCATRTMTHTPRHPAHQNEKYTKTIHVMPGSTTSHKPEPQNRAFRASETPHPEDPEQPETPGEWL